MRCRMRRARRRGESSCTAIARSHTAHAGVHAAGARWALAWRDLALDAERSPDTSRCGLRGAAACSIESSAGMLLSRPVDRSDLRAVEWLEKWLLVLRSPPGDSLRRDSVDMLHLAESLRSRMVSSEPPSKNGSKPLLGSGAGVVLHCVVRKSASDSSGESSWPKSVRLVRFPRHLACKHERHSE